jgi:cell filamentation protein
MSDDPYCYPGTDVLKNKHDIRDKKMLAAKESLLAEVAAAKNVNLTGPFDAKRLKATHKLLFGATYDWAGEFRQNTGKMERPREAGYTVTYGPSAYVEPQLADTFGKLAKENYLKGLSPEKFAERLAFYYSELDSAHAFREGNSRTLRRFTSDLAKEAGHNLDWSRAITTDAERQRLYLARDFGVMKGETSRLTAIVAECLKAPVQERAADRERPADNQKQQASRRKPRTKDSGLERD